MPESPEPPTWSTPQAGETTLEVLRTDAVALADELRDQQLPARMRRAVETIRHWQGEAVLPPRR